ncbi:hypothetical protein JCM14036_07800 [Desulfotomaculum defluvii]
MQIRPDTIFLIVLFILPGFFSQTLIRSLSKKEETTKKSDITYLSILHSLVIYTIIYPILILIWGLDIHDVGSIKNLLLSTRWAPMATVGLLAVISFTWALIYLRFEVFLVKTLRRYIRPTVEPPNVYARLLDSDYRKSSEPNSHWITIRVNDKLIEGGVEYVVAQGEYREVFLTNVAYLDIETREILYRLPENTGVVINLDNVDISEVTSVRINN